MSSFWTRDKFKSWTSRDFSSFSFNFVYLYSPNLTLSRPIPKKDRKISRRNLSISRTVKLWPNGSAIWGLSSFKKVKKPPYLINHKLHTLTKAKSSESSTNWFKKIQASFYPKDIRKLLIRSSLLNQR